MSAGGDGKTIGLGRSTAPVIWDHANPRLKPGATRFRRILGEGVFVASASAAGAGAGAGRIVWFRTWWVDHCCVCGGSAICSRSEYSA